MTLGQKAKIEVFDKIKEVFPDAFMDNKIMRIPFNEDGNYVEIKVALTEAKEPLRSPEVRVEDTEVEFEDTQPAVAEITEEEKNNVISLMERLGL